MALNGCKDLQTGLRVLFKVPSTKRRQRLALFQGEERGGVHGSDGRGMRNRGRRPSEIETGCGSSLWSREEAVGYSGLAPWRLEVLPSSRAVCGQLLVLADSRFGPSADGPSV